MSQTSTGNYRVYPGRNDSEWLLLDVETDAPTYVPRKGPAASFNPGNRVRATVAFTDGDAEVTEGMVARDTRFRFYRPDADTRLFEAARTCWRTAEGAGEAMNSRVTHSTDGKPNGVVYTFAEQAGERDVFEEFRDGSTPLDPLLARAAHGAEPPFEAFAIDHPKHPFVVVYIALERDGLLARTVRETYGTASLTELGNGLDDLDLGP